MTTMNTQDVITSCALVRQVIGFAKQGVMIHPGVRGLALDRFKERQAQEALEPDAVKGTARVLEQLRTGVLPQAALCRSAMQEIDQFLLPLRRDQRARESMLDDGPVRERQRG